MTNSATATVMTAAPRKSRRRWSIVSGMGIRSTCSAFGCLRINELVGDCDIAARGLGIRAGLVRGVDQGPGHVGREAGQADVMTRLQEISALDEAEVHLDIVRRICGKGDFLLAGGKLHRAQEAGGPARGEQLLGIGACAGRAGNRKFDLEAPVVAARSAAASARGVDLGGCRALFRNASWRTPLVMACCLAGRSATGGKRGGTQTSKRESGLLDHGVGGTLVSPLCVFSPRARD